MHEIIEIIECTAEGVYTPEGDPWPDSRGHINNFYTEDGQQYIGTLHRVRLEPQAWRWEIPEQEPQPRLF